MSSRLITAVLAGTLILAACGSDDSSDATDTTPAPADAPADSDGAATPAAEADPVDAGSAIVGVASTDLGDVLVDADGLTLYGFTPDVGAVPTCFDACAQAWPPIVIDSAELPAGLDPAVFSVVERPGEGFQLAAGEWPLYLFAGDAAPGDVNGQGSGGNWFVAAPDGSLIGA